MANVAIKTVAVETIKESPNVKIICNNRIGRKVIRENAGDTLKKEMPWEKRRPGPTGIEPD